MSALTKSIQENAEILKNADIVDLNVSYLAGSSHKIELSNKYHEGEYYSSVLYLLQEKLSGKNMCPNATDSCREICLGTHSGHASMMKKGNKTNIVQLARLKRSILFSKHRDYFLKMLSIELLSLELKANNKGSKPAFRFNGTSDIPVENLGIIEKFPNIMFYDYTKSKSRMEKFLAGKMPSNYHLTFSYSPEHESDAITILALGGNVATVFDEKATKKHEPTFIGKLFLGHKVINGNEHDLRFTDPKGGYVVGLTRKGRNNLKGKAFFVPTNRLTIASKASVA